MRSNGLTARLMVADEEIATSDHWSLTSIPLPDDDDHHVDPHRHILELEPNPWHGLAVEPDLSVCLPSRRRTADPIWVRFVSAGTIVGGIDGPLVAWRSTADRLVVVIDGDAVDELILGLYLVLHRHDVIIDWRELRDAETRGAWLLACLTYQPELTPWTRVHRSPDPPPPCPRRGERIDIRLTVEAFEDRSSLYCFLGEAILGYGGYVGQDLDGLHEVIGAIVHEEISLVVTIVDPEAVRAVMSDFWAHVPDEPEDHDLAEDGDADEGRGRGDYFDAFFEVLRDRGVPVVFVEP